MPLFINTNVSSLYAQRAAQRANDALDISYQRLSSGLRINRAKDDAAGMQVSNNLTTQLDGLTQGNRNAQDGLAFAQTIEGALDEVTNMLQRIRTLAVQASNGTMSDQDRNSLQVEVTQLSDEITRISNDTTFAGMLQRIRTLAVQASNGTMSDQDRNSLQVEVTQLSDEITRISNDTTFAGADVLNGNASISRFQVGADPSSIIEMDLRDGTDINGIVKMLVRYTGKDEFANPMVTDPNAPGGHDPMLKFEDIFKNNGTNPGIRVEKASAAQATLAGIDGLINAIDRKRAELGAMQNRLEATVRGTNPGIRVEKASAAQATLAGIDGLINAIDRKRAELGAMQNRLEATVRNQESVKENVASSRATIRDTDFAEETANLTQQQIIQQATATILTQANQRPQIALSLMQK